MKTTLLKILNPFWRLYKLLVLQPVYALRNTWSMWRFANRKSVSLQKQHPLPLNTIAEQAVAGLTKDGIYTTHIDELFPDSHWFQELSEYAESCKEHSFQNTRKTYWTEMWDVKSFMLDLKNPFLRFALEDTTLAIANAYIGMYTELHSISLSETKLMSLGAPEIQSQKWHRDPGNKKYVKMFLYLNDVGENDGPFMYVRGSQPHGPHNHIFPQLNPYSSQSGRIPEDDLQKHISQKDIIHCTGKAGTIVFADTTGIHRGGYSIDNTRFASITGYYSQKSLEQKKHWNRFVYPENFKDAIRHLSAPAQFALLSTNRSAHME